MAERDGGHGRTIEVPHSAPLGRIAAVLTGLILILLAIQLQVEHAGEIASGVLPATTAATSAERDLNVAECGLGP